MIKKLTQQSNIKRYDFTIEYKWNEYTWILSVWQDNDKPFETLKFDNNFWRLTEEDEHIIMQELQQQLHN